MNPGSDGTTDEILYRRFLGGDFQAFELLYDRYRAPLYRYLLRGGGGLADVEDIYQEVWMRILRRSDAFSSGSFRAFAYQIARNLQIDAFRRRRLRPLADPDAGPEPRDPAPEPDQRAQDADCGERLLREVGALPQEQRDAFLLKEEAGLSLEQIAELARVGRETIKSRLRYAMKRLRQALEDCL